MGEEEEEEEGGLPLVVLRRRRREEEEEEEQVEKCKRFLPLVSWVSLLMLLKDLTLERYNLLRTLCDNNNK